MNDTDKTEAVHDYERNTFCSEHIYQASLGQLHYTDGIKFVAETCGAYWLIDLVASHQPPIFQKMRDEDLRPFQVWRIKKKGADHWLIDCWSDTPGGNPPDEGPSIQLAEQELEYSDFPAGLSGFEFWVEGTTMLLKAEH